METRCTYLSENTIKNINQFFSIYMYELKKNTEIDSGKKKELLDSVSKLADFLDVHWSLMDDKPDCFSLTLEEIYAPKQSFSYK